MECNEDKWYCKVVIDVSRKLKFELLALNDMKKIEAECGDDVV